MFMKLPTSSVGPAGPVRCPAVVKRLDYEVELALVLGPGSEIAGYAVADDVSARDLQKREPQWTRAKGADTFCPWGPWITTADEVADPEDLRLTDARQRRAAPGLAHVRPDLRPARARRLHRRGDHAGARRPHPHRHAERRRPGDGPAALPRRRRRRALRGRGARCRSSTGSADDVACAGHRALRRHRRALVRPRHNRGPARGPRGPLLHDRDADRRGARSCRPAPRSDLFYALLLKDAGCSANAERMAALFGADDQEAKRTSKLVDWSSPAAGVPVVAADRRARRRPARARRLPARASRTRATSRASSWRRAATAAPRSRACSTCRRRPRPRSAASTSTGTGAASPTGCAARRSRCSRASSASPRRSRSSTRAAASRPRARSRKRRRGRWFDPALVDALLAICRDRGVLGDAGRARRLRLGARRPAARRRRRAPRPDRRGVRPRDRREVAVHRAPLRARRRDRRRDRRRARLRPDHAARPAPRRPAARHRQARDLQPDPRQAGQADRRRVREDQGAPGLLARDPRARAVLRADRRARRQPPRADRRHRLPARARRRRRSTCRCACSPSPTSTRRSPPTAPTAGRCRRRRRSTSSPGRSRDGSTAARSARSRPTSGRSTDPLAPGVARRSRSRRLVRASAPGRSARTPQPRRP